MSEFEWIIAVLTVFSALLLPTLAIMIRGAVKWTRTEDKLGNLVDDVRELVADQDKTHAGMLTQMASDRNVNNQTHKEILEQMRQDREATNTRLRYLEEWFIGQGMRGLGPNTARRDV